MVELPRYPGLMQAPKDFVGPCYIGTTNMVFWISHQILHRLDGPAQISENKLITCFFIHGYLIDPDLYWNHPKVIECKIQSIVNV